MLALVGFLKHMRSKPKWMIILRPLLLLFAAALLVASCSDPKRVQELDKREQNLLQREKEFASKAADYQSLLLMRDSLFSRKDTGMLSAWPESIQGSWNGKIVCKESNCSDYVVGDQRVDNWEFVSDSTGLFTRVINKGKLIRIYSADADSTTYRLNYQTDTAASRKVMINVTLKPVDSTLIKGTQIINVNNNCTARFSVELVRTSTP